MMNSSVSSSTYPPSGALPASASPSSSADAIRSLAPCHCSPITVVSFPPAISSPVRFPGMFVPAPLTRRAPPRCTTSQPWLRTRCHVAGFCGETVCHLRVHCTRRRRDVSYGLSCWLSRGMPSAAVHGTARRRCQVCVFGPVTHRSCTSRGLSYVLTPDVCRVGCILPVCVLCFCISGRSGVLRLALVSV